MTPDERPFDAVDFGLMLTTAIVPPHWPFALLLGVSTVIRRSPRASAYLLDALGFDTAPAWLLPGAATKQLPSPRGVGPNEGDTLDSLSTPDAPPTPVDSLRAALATLPKRVDLARLRLPSSSTAIPLGVDADGNPTWIDLSKDTYHVGLYGQTGCGKDTLLRCWFVLLARRNAPSGVQFAIIDGKGDWLTPQLANLGHMFTPPAGGYGKRGDAAILDAVKIIDTEAERRHEVIRAAGCTNREAYVTKTNNVMPILIVICTDVMTSVAGDVESLLISLVSKARSLGIRVIVSMQTPTKQDTRWRGNLSTVLAGALQSGSQDEPALGINPRDLRYRPSQLPPPAQRPGVFCCRTAGIQTLVQAPYVSDHDFDQHCAALPATPQRTPQNDEDTLLTSLLSLPVEVDGHRHDVAPVPPQRSTVAPPVTPSGRDVTPPVDVAPTMPSPLEIAQIAHLLATLPRSEVVKRCGGNGRNYGRVKAKVDFIAALLATDTKPSDTPTDTPDDLDRPGGPDLPGAFNF